MMTIMMNMKTQKSNTVAKRSAGGEEIFQVRQREYTGHAVAFFRKVGNLTQGELASQIPCSVDSIGRIQSAVFTGIGGCSHAEIQTFIPQKGAFETEILDGMLELINITGNIITDDDQLFHHTHAVFSFKSESEHKIAAGHMKALTVLYTAEIELRPVIGGVIKRKQDPETGTGFWSFE